jgi:hypothetical protein
MLGYDPFAALGINFFEASSIFRAHIREEQHLRI